MTLTTSYAMEEHPSEDEWAQFASRSMNAHDRARILEHIAGCANCSALSRTLGADRPDVHERPWRRGLATVAALVLALAGWSWLVRVPSVERAVLAPQAVTTPDSVAQPITQVAAVASWASLGRAPDVTLPASLTLEMRGEPNRNDAFLRAFGSAITPYRDGRYAAAAQALEKVAASYPDIPEAWFYLGVSRLHAGEPAMAVDGLRRAATSTEVGDAARWLEAVALERSSQHDSARRLLDDLCAGTGPYRVRACDARSISH
jgi:TolA-binding protein